MASAAYLLFEQAMRARRRVVCTYQGLVRVVCPIVLGHSQGLEKALTFQIGGESRSGLPPGGEWRCLWVAKVEGPRVQDGRGSPTRATRCRRGAWRWSIST